MTAALAPLGTAALPRWAVALSIGAHAAALLLLPGLGRNQTHLELPPLTATLRLLPAMRPAAEAPLPVAVSESRPAHRPAVPHTEERHATPVPTPVPAVRAAESPAAVAAPAPGPETAAREEFQVREPTPPAPAPRPAPTPPPAVPDSLVLDDYGRALADLLARQQQYPRLAALRGWEGEVRLRLLVARKGSLVAVEVVHSSGHEVLDQHALALIQGAALPAPPAALGDREIQVVVPIHYKLQKST